MRLVEGLSASTAASGMPAPEASCTVPTRSPLIAWPRSGDCEHSAMPAATASTAQDRFGCTKPRVGLRRTECQCPWGELILTRGRTAPLWGRLEGVPSGSGRLAIGLSGSQEACVRAGFSIACARTSMLLIRDFDTPCLLRTAAYSLSTGAISGWSTPSLRS